MTAKGAGTDRKKPGPKPDDRNHVTFRVEHPVYAILSEMQPQTGQTPDQVAGLLLHILLTDPANAVARLNALVGHVSSDDDKPMLLRKGVAS